MVTTVILFNNSYAKTAWFSVSFMRGAKIPTLNVLMFKNEFIDSQIFGVFRHITLIYSSAKSDSPPCKQTVMQTHQ